MTSGSPESGLTKRKTQYFSHFAVSHMPEMRRLGVGKILGEDSEGWRNVAEHNLLAGVVASKIAELVGLPEADLEEVTSVATTHDWDKRLDKERFGKAEKVNSGVMWVKTYDIDAEIKQEQSKKGLVRVTGEDWRDFDTWGAKEKILRYVDSSLTPTPDGHADFVDWRIRLADLRNRRAEAQVKAGMQLYGKPAYDRLVEITEQIEAELYEMILASHPELAQKYPEKEMLSALILDQITQDITNTS